VSEDQSSKTYDASPQRREQSRKEGRFARARDPALPAQLAMLAGLLGLLAEPTLEAWSKLVAETFRALERVTHGEGVDFTRGVLGAGTLVAGPVLALGACGLSFGFAQAGIRFDAELLLPKPDRFDLFAHLKEALSPKRAAVEAGLSVARALLVLGLVYVLLERGSAALFQHSGDSFGDVAAEASAIARRILLHVAAGLGVVTALDYLQARLRHERELKMTRKEMMDETRAEDGDPKVKARMRAQARRFASARSIAHVKDADVIVTNPTHIAVALRYGPGDPAPTVVAKGQDEVALRIRMEARKRGIPIVENRPIARALHAHVAPGQVILPEHFVAVARILAYVYRIHGGRRRSTGTRHASLV